MATKNNKNAVFNQATLAGMMLIWADPNIG
jgi:hypothetical protein